MKALALGGCGCASAIAVALVCTPLLLLGVASGDAGTSGPASTGTRVVPADGGTCTAAVGCQRVPSELSWVPGGLYPDTFVNPPGECTSWAAALWPGHDGHGVSWSGDAWEWFGNAASQGYAVSATPSVGAIAVFARSGGEAGAWGHVAIVLSVGDGTFRVTEMNWMSRFVVDERSVPFPAEGVVGFIPVPGDAFGVASAGGGGAR